MYLLGYSPCWVLPFFLNGTGFLATFHYPWLSAHVYVGQCLWASLRVQVLLCLWENRLRLAASQVCHDLPFEAVPATRGLSIARAYIHHFILGQTYLGWATHKWFPNWSIWGLPSWSLLILPLAAPKPHYLSSNQLWGRYLSSLVSLSVWLFLLYDSQRFLKLTFSATGSLFFFFTSFLVIFVGLLKHILFP